MRVLSIDPGYDRVGVAILERTKTGKDLVLFSTCLTTTKDLLVAERIWLNCQSIANIITDHTPTHLAIETLFFNKNVKTASAVAEARGAYRLVAQQANLKIIELNPKKSRSR